MFRFQCLDTGRMGSKSTSRALEGEDVAYTGQAVSLPHEMMDNSDEDVEARER
jgi:hypothetical protein